MRLNVKVDSSVHVHEDGVPLTQEQVAFAAAEHATAGQGLLGSMCHRPKRVEFKEPFEKDGHKVWPVLVVFETMEYADPWKPPEVAKEGA